MPESVLRVISIIRTDILFRFRRTAAVVTMLLVATGVYFIIPDVSTGFTLIEVDGARVLYTSSAVALGTGMFCGPFLSFIGFYVVSNSFRRDILTRTGFIVASTPVTNMEYIVGKFLGNILYLTAMMVTCMLSSMVMFLIRGEGSLEPLVFLGMYLWMVLPAILFCSAIAIAFEALPLLSGRFGDVVFFFVFWALLGLPAALAGNGVEARWLSAFDLVGFVPIIGFLKDQFHTTSITIGLATFDVTRAPVLFAGVPWSWGLVVERLTTLLPPIALLALARVWFHRFNPTKIRISVRQSRKNVLVRANVLLKPLTRILQPFARGTGESRHTSLLSAVRADVLTTLSLSPLVLVAFVILAILSICINAELLRSVVLPAIILVLVIALGDIATRDESAGMLSLLFSTPHLKRNYVPWKCVSTLTIVFSFTLIPLARLLFELPNAALSLFIGSAFVAAGAVAFGIVTRSRKVFIAFFLMLLYIALNAKEVPAFDFAGLYGHATLAVHLSYSALTLLLVSMAYIKHQFRLRS